MPHLRSNSDHDKPHRFDAAYIQMVEDAEFDSAYPESVQAQSDGNWTPVAVCRKAAEFLDARPGTRVLDVGCGPGKFCAIGAIVTKAHFTGIEQRANLVWAGREMISSYAIERAVIIQGNVLDIDFSRYDAFYLYNPFQEHIVRSMKIDSTIPLHPQRYTSYVRHVAEQLAMAPRGTRVVTFWGECEEVPDCYEVRKTAFGGLLKLWVKTSG